MPGTNVQAAGYKSAQIGGNFRNLVLNGNTPIILALASQLPVAALGAVNRPGRAADWRSCDRWGRRSGKRRLDWNRLLPFDRVLAV